MIKNGLILTFVFLVTTSMVNGQEPIVDRDLIFAETDGLVAVEAEHFFEQTLTETRAFYLTTVNETPNLEPDHDPSHAKGASGGAYLEILPDTRVTHADKLIHETNFAPQPGKMTIVRYKVNITAPGRYYVWVRAFSTGTEDNGLHVGFDGTWPESGQRLQWAKGKGTWRWDSMQRTEKVHTGVPHQIYLDIEEPGVHEIQFSMREDGFEFDKWLMTTDRDFKRPADSGPAPVVHSGNMPEAFKSADVENWPQFRGTGATGISNSNPPVEWDIESGTNIAWKTSIEGLGHSAPVIWGDHVFLTTAVNSKQKSPSLSTGWDGANGQAAPDEGDWTWKVLCLNRNDGTIKWSKDANQGVPAIERHTKASHANCTPATNGEVVVAFFGSEGLFCYDFDGKLLWDFDFGRLHSGPYNAEKLEWGFASSPVIFGDYVIVQCDCLNAGFISILNLGDGKEIKRIKRNDVATWSTPGVFDWNGHTQIVCNGFKEMAGYDLESGDQLWKLSGGGDVPVPTPLFHDGLIYLSNSHAGSHGYAVSPDARGDITPSEENALPEGLVWHAPRGGSYMPTPIIVDELHYTCDDRGVLTVRDTKTGDEIYKQRVSKSGNNFTASAVGTPDRLYFAAESGNVVVIKTGTEYELLAKNDLGEVIMATPAIAGDQLFVRSAESLFCIGRNEK